MANTLARHEDGTIELHITIPAATIKKTRGEVMAQVASTAKVAGFRPGKAPKKVVEDTADKAKVREEVLRVLIPQTYIEAIQEHKLKPIVNPKIHVDKLEDDQDWEFTATTCEMPKVELGKYKEAVKNVTAKSKIIVPGKEDTKPDLDTIVKEVVGAVTVTIPAILTDYEADRLLSQTLDEIKKLGLSLDQYLSSTNKTPEQLREEYVAKATMDMKLEFALQEIADTEKITVDPKEIEEAISKAKDPAEKTHLESNKYMLANIIRQQKTLDFLQNL